MTDDERDVMMQHVGYWTGLAHQGLALAVGPVGDPAGSYGIALVIAADQASADALAAKDPATESGLGFRTEITPMLRLVTPTEQY